MHGGGKSDRPVLPVKPPNNTGTPVAEVVEGRGRTKENAIGKTGAGHRPGEHRTNALDGVRQVARKDKEARFTALLHHISPQRLREAYWALNPKAAPGVDEVSWADYGENLDENIEDLLNRVHTGAYRPSPTRRTFIPKANGQPRPLGITTLEDKVLQRATVEVLNAIYEEDFAGFSYGFRQGRNQHDCLDALSVGIDRKNVNWVLDADIAGFFDSIDHSAMLEILGRRIADERLLRLIAKWLKAGVLEEGIRSETVQGTSQGASVSPLLANVFLHYALDRWVQWWRRSKAHGNMIAVRFADDTVYGFEHENDAKQFLNDLRERLAKYQLELSPEKTRLIEFGRNAVRNRKARGLGKPETFDFLGFTHICGRSKKGHFWLKRITIKKRMRAKLHSVKDEMKRRRHRPIPEQGKWLASVVRGHCAYYAVPGNTDAVRAFRDQVVKLWCKSLKRRSQRSRLDWKRMDRLAKRWLPRIQCMHPFPSVRFDVIHPR